MQKRSLNIPAMADALPGTADIAIILGSGLGPFADTLADATSVKTNDLPGYPVSTVAGHAGKIVFGKLGQARVMAFQGRIHMYEGYSPEQVSIPVRLAHAKGARQLIVTNACGGISKRFRAGDLMVIEDHINLQFRNPLRGPQVSGDSRWPDMCDCYSEELKQLAERAAREQGIRVQRGTLAAVLGPTYETPAEIQMLARMGADGVCMSTVPEVITAAAIGMQVLGLSCVTNAAAGVTGERLSHEEVQAVAAQAAADFGKLVSRIMYVLQDGGWGMGDGR
ncbi:MAG: purine-nucleoside phosphorylase [Calditrichaeota bacterium]|nr:purine-nucleoside phosphorylase [Calditrichota bacterium]MCB9391357.1 purine-nucleoside phosphorylase [Calditrichota bacterium]